ncbi:MAG: hypothetical protein ABEJ31_08380 [Haloarculaceae archaeon]
MYDRPSTDSDGRLAPIVPAMPTRRFAADGGRAYETETHEKFVEPEADAPLVPDLS